MTFFVANVFLAAVWVLLIGEFTPVNFIAGFVLGYACLRAASVRGRTSAYFVKAFTIARFIGLFVRELVSANLTMVRYTLGPLRRLRPGILAIPLEPGMSELEISTLANIITLTPGTLSLDVSEDRSLLFVHFMDVDDPEKQIRAIKDGFEAGLLDITRPMAERAGRARGANHTEPAEAA